MTDLPRRVEIREEGPREGFQIEPGPIPTARKIALVDALSGTGLHHIQVCSFVSPKIVPGWADAEQVAAGFEPAPGVTYTALWFNAAGMARALSFRDRMTVETAVTVVASEAFSLKNLNRDRAKNIEAQHVNIRAHQDAGVPVTRISVQAAFGCNYAGDVPVEAVIQALEDAFAIGAAHGLSLPEATLADTMGWATPARIERVVGEVRSRWPDLSVILHLHDTRGLGIANAHAGLRMGIHRFDTTVGGLGGCPFAGQPGAPGNIASEELVLLCEEMGIETGVDLDALVQAGRLAEEVVGHRLPSTLLRSGTLARFRRVA